MKTVNYLPALTFVILSFFSIGQEEKPLKRIVVSDVQLYSGMLFKMDVNGTLADFRSLAPQSELLKNDFSSYPQDERYGSSGDMGISMMIGIQFRDKKNERYRANPLLRLGFNYSSGLTIAGSMSKGIISPFDTLTSAQTSNVYSIDSTHSESYHMFYSSEQLRFDGSLMFRTNPEARWSVFSGVGITAGISINANSRIHYTESKSQYIHGPGGSYIHSSEYRSLLPTNEEYEEHRNKTSFGFSAYVPLGLDFRLANGNKFWSRMHLFYEAKLAVDFTSIPELYTVTNTTFQHGLGIRYCLGRN